MKLETKPRDDGGEWVKVKQMDGVPFTVVFMRENFTKKGPFKSKQTNADGSAAPDYCFYEISGKFSWVDVEQGGTIETVADWSLMDKDYGKLMSALGNCDGRLKDTKWKIKRYKDGNKVLWAAELLSDDPASTTPAPVPPPGEAGGVKSVTPAPTTTPARPPVKPDAF